jgi:inhibitor of cysteine peptidase
MMRLIGGALTALFFLAAGARAGGAAPAGKARIGVGETYWIKLPCNPTTGYDWELKSIDRKVAAPTGPVDFQRDEAVRGMVGVGGTCVLGVKGVKPGKTKVVLVYRRPWEKGKPSRTYKAELTVLPKKSLTP